MISVADEVTGGSNVPAIQLLPCIIKGNLKSCCFLLFDFMDLINFTWWRSGVSWVISEEPWFWIGSLLFLNQSLELSPRSKDRKGKVWLYFVNPFGLDCLHDILYDHSEGLDLSRVMAPSVKAGVQARGTELK